MNDLNRERHDTEIERLQDKMASLDPTSEEYTRLAKNYDILVRTANEDDLNQSNINLERIRIDAEADKAAEEVKQNKRAFWAPIITTGITSVTSIGIYVFICVMNRKNMDAIMFFEQNGYALTTQCTKNQVNLPPRRI